MPIVPLFTKAQSIPSAFTLTDTSTGSDVAITQRRVFLQKSNGSFLVPIGTTTDYIQWAYASPSITISALDKDYALAVTVQWLDVSNTIRYSKPELHYFQYYSEDFYYALTRSQADNPEIVNHANYYPSKIKLRTSIDEAMQAVDYGSSISAAQNSFNRAKKLIDNPSYFY